MPFALSSRRPPAIAHRQNRHRRSVRRRNTFKFDGPAKGSPCDGSITSLIWLLRKVPVPAGEYSDEVYTGKLLRHYAKSHFLDHLGLDTGGHMNLLRHYKVICLNHLIDVASENPPEIELVQGI